MKFSVLSLLAVAALGTLLLSAGCSPATSPEPTSGGEVKKPDAAKTYTIGMSQCNLGEPWRVQMNKDLENAAKEHPEIKMVFKDAQNDSLKQRGHVEEFVQDKVDLIIISPKEAQPLTEPVAKAYEAGIPVIVLDRAVNGDKFTCFIGSDNKRIGKAAGEWLAKQLPNGGNLVELKGLETSIPSHDRHDGFADGLKGSPIKTVFTADMKWLEPDARKEMESALARFPKIDAVYAHNDPGAHGAYLAAKAAGREKEMIFIGIDALPHEGVMYVDQGILAVTFQYPTGGKEAIETALKIFAGETVEKQMVLGTRIFTKDNVKTGGEAVD